MSIKSVSRRDILKSLTMGAMATSVLRVIPAHAAEYAHHMVAAEKAAAPAGAYTPKFFSPKDYKTLQALCQTIIPADSECGGAMEAGAPEFIDLLTSENPEYQLKLGGGMMWLDGECADRYGKPFLDCAAGTAEGNSRSDCLSQECRKGSRPAARVWSSLPFFAR